MFRSNFRNFRIIAAIAIAFFFAAIAAPAQAEEVWFGAQVWVQDALLEESGRTLEEFEGEINTLILGVNDLHRNSPISSPWRHVAEGEMQVWLGTEDAWRQAQLNGDRFSILLTADPSGYENAPSLAWPPVPGFSKEVALGMGGYDEDEDFLNSRGQLAHAMAHTLGLGHGDGVCSREIITVMAMTAECRAEVRGYNPYPDFLGFGTTEVVKLRVAAELFGPTLGLNADPDPPYDAWQTLNTPQSVLDLDELFFVQIRIGGAGGIQGGYYPFCLPETSCFHGAVEERAEVLVRVVGPKGNKKLWPTVVKFTTSEVEVWFLQLTTNKVEYYRLPGASPGVDELPGLFDRNGFTPVKPVNPN